MGKLHELLAVEQPLKKQAAATRADLINTFTKKHHLFGEKRVTFTSRDEGAQPVTETQSDLQTTVRRELKWIADLWEKSVDTSLQVAYGNTFAVADVLLEDGTTLAEGVPATALLELEKRAGEVVDLVKAIPTLDPAKAFRPDTQRGEGIYVAREVTKQRMRKEHVVITLHPPTKEHPAQVQLVNEDRPVGTVTELEWSGMLTPADKGDMLERAEALQRAIKKALSRANSVEVKQDKAVAGRMFGYVFGQ
jgi:hypothetical protein